MRALGKGLLIWLFLGFLAGTAMAGQNAQYYLDDRGANGDQPGLPHYANPEEACVVGIMERKVRAYQAGTTYRYRYRGLYVGQDDGFGEFACQGVIERQLYIPGQNWVTVEDVATNSYGPFGTSENCTLTGLSDTVTGQCGPPICPRCMAGDGPSPVVGNPIDAGTGNKHQVETDYQGSGAFPIVFSRSYDSSRTWLANPVPVSIGWTHNYLSSVALMPAPGSSTITEAILHRGDGSILRFYLVGTVWTPDADIPLRLSVAIDSSGTATATVTTADDTVESYDSQGRLISLTNRDGLTQTVIYTTAPGGTTTSQNDVQQVIDPQGHTLTFGYNTSGQLASLTDGNGAVVRYTYDGNGNLSTVVYPDLGTATKTRTYTYNEAGQVSGASWPNALTGIIDENNSRFASWGYDAMGRAVSSVHGAYATGTIDKYQLTFNSDGTTSFIDPLGQSRTYGFAVSWTVARPASLNTPCDMCSAHDQARTYNTNGYSATSTDFNSVQGSYAYAPTDSAGPRGLQSQLIEAVGKNEQRTTNTMWAPVFHVPTQRTVLNKAGATMALTNWVYNTRGQPLFRCDVDPTVSGASSYVCGSNANAPTGVRQWAYTYCEQAGVTAGTCPLVGLRLTLRSPRTDVNATTTYAYYPTTNLTGCTGTGACYYKGDLQTVTNALGQVTTFTRYDGDGRPTQSTDANGVVTNLTYHPRGWITQRAVLGTSNAVTSYAYDGVGQVTQVTQPAGDYFKFGYDLAHRLTDTTDNVGNVLHYVLDPMGNRIEEDSKTSATGTVTRKVLRQYSTLGRLMKLQNANTATRLSFLYDGNGNRKTTTDGLGRITNDSYDGLNRLTTDQQDAAGVNAIINYTYDVIDRLIDVQDPQGLHTSYQFDGLGNQTKLTSPDTGITTYTYDAAGNRLGQTDARPLTTSYTYDALDRLTGTTYPTPSLAIGYRYDTLETGCSAANNNFAKGHLTRITDASGSTIYCYDRFGRRVTQIQTINALSYTTQYTYDLGDHLTQTITPKNTTVTYTRDADLRIASAAYKLSGQTTATPVVSAMAYLPFGPVSSIAYGNGRTLNRSYDQNYWVQGIKEATTADGLSYGYLEDVLGNITRLTTTSTGTVGNAFQYDGLNRLKEVDDLATPANLIVKYTYDATGNRLSKASPTLSQAYTYPTTSHHLVAVAGFPRAYDAIGNTTSLQSAAATTYGFGFDDRNRMTSSKLNTAQVGSYQYDGRGQRVYKSAGSSKTATAFDASGHVLGEYDGGTQAIQREILWIDDLPVGVLTGATPTLAYLEPDHLGTPRAAISAANHAAIWSWPLLNNPFGEAQPTGSLMLDLRFPGQTFDAESGMSYNYFRDYDSSTGRYLQSDPIGLNGGINTYQFALSRPLSTVDPSGLIVLLTCHLAAAPLGRLTNPNSYHCGIYMDPDNRKCCKGENWPITVGGQPQDGKLVTRVNYPGDALENGQYYQLVPTPSGMTDCEFIKKILHAAAGYDNGLPYSFPQNASYLPGVPDGWMNAGTYNSNSYVSGVLKAAGAGQTVINSDGSFQTPGLQNPIPLPTR
ncbi:MAG: RHS repeat protein [Proteobacteria bacterium]|nr:RHS repeat protein [Pseudomonadota bacterium]